MDNRLQQNLSVEYKVKDRLFNTYSDDSYQSNNYLWKVLLLHKKIFGRIMPEEAG